MLIIETMNKAGRPRGSKNTPKRTLDLRDYIPPPPPKFKITSSQRKLLKEYNPEGLPDFRTKDFKNLSYDDKENYILEQLAIAKENKKNNRKIIKINDYIELDVSEFPYYGRDNNNQEFIELIPFFYSIYKKYRGNNVIFRYTNNNQILITNNFNIPLKNFSKWWKNFSKFGYGIFTGLSDEFKYIEEIVSNDFTGNIYIYKQINNNKKDEKIFMKQFFKDHHISNCLLEPIKQWAINIKEKAESKSTFYRYKKIEEKVNNYIDYYINSGVPQDEIENICNDLQIDISISLPLQKEKKLLEAKSNKKPLRHFNFINTKFNHIETDDIIYENNIIKTYKDKATIKNIDEKFLRNLKNNLDEDDKFYIYRMNGDILSSILTQEGQYIIYDEFQDYINIFEIETGLNNCKICDIEDFDLSTFVRDSCHYNCSLNFVDKLDEIKNINHIDMKKAYINYKSCSYYNGFLGKITDFRKTNKIMGVGLYQIDNIDFSNCKIKKILLKLNIYHNKYIYTSPELKFLEDNNIKFDIISGAWGHSPIDFDFPNYMIDKKDKNEIPYYAKWCGFINSQFLQKNYYLKSSYNYNHILKNYGVSYDNITYLEHNQETQITINKKNNYHLSHVNSFITSYQRLNLIEQLLEIDYDNLIKINVDCIYYYGNDNIKLKNVFRHKEFNYLKLNDCDNSLIPLFEEIQNYKYSNIEVNENYKSKINLGCGGSGKTTKELRDDGLMKKLFCPPSWKLARNKEKEENVKCSVWYYIITKDPEIRNKILKKYNVLIIDEVSMMTEETKKFILEEFKLCKIIFCGDLGYQLPPIDNDEMTTEGIEKIEYFNNNYRCKCPKLLELLNKCRKMIKDNKPLFYINQWIINFFEINKRIINLDKLKELYDINDMILSGTNELKNFYSDIFKGKFEMKKLYITSNSRQYSNGEILITNEKPIGVSSEERYCYTTHSIQGETAYNKLFIDISKMFDERMFYTALSRAMYLDQIYLISMNENNENKEVIKPIKTNFFNIPVDIRNIIWNRVKKEKNEMKYYKFLIEDFFYKNFSHFFTNWKHHDDTNYEEQTNNKNTEYMYNIIREYQIKGKDLTYLFREDDYKDKFLNEYNFLRIYNKFFNNRQEEYKEIQDFLNGDGAEFNEIDYNNIYIFYLYEQLYISLKKML